ncbi:uncharacterized protein LOC132550023 [Ylistrum balloti]|uniref:uncharacterized protein LOC132550023 n=1 Tax=Ylistrum balloti TaxID=509963 RepID=UPI002905E507|nr:uncharacterized protein LOC132550023 [Ylistrum balloti]
MCQNLKSSRSEILVRLKELQNRRKYLLDKLTGKRKSKYVKELACDHLMQTSRIQESESENSVNTGTGTSNSSTDSDISTISSNESKSSKIENVKAAFNPGDVVYGDASDKFSAFPNCSPRGTFKIDFVGTPFTIAKNIQWTWQGNFVGGSTAKGVAHVTNNSYIGCFVDADDRLMGGHFENNAHMTTELCIQHCKTLGFWYAGTQYRTQCFCGDNHDRHSLATESDCNSPCGGNSKEICGGTWRVSVYGTGVRQIFEGRCGGFPGGCYPATVSDPSNPILALQVVPSHPCLQPISPCKNEGKCVASSASGFHCLCYSGYTGSMCDIPNQVITTNLTCPVGMIAEKCTCDRSCYGAAFKGDKCKVYGSRGVVKPLTTCRPGIGNHIIMFNVEGSGMVKCPPGSNLTGCTYRDRGYYPVSSGNHKFMTATGEATQIRYNTGTCSLLHSCQSCTLQARCKKFDCGCQNGGHCHMITGECICTQGYYGEKCENFDYCGYYETHNNVTACGAGGICSAIPQEEIKAYGGDNAGDTCVFPFQYGTNSYGSCIQSNSVGPPFACGTKFDGQRDGYIDLGLWSPGTQYTIAAWVRPDVADVTRRTIVGGVGDCKDFGLYHFENFWAYYRGQGADSICTRGLSAVDKIQTGQWYLIASIKNDTHVTLYVNGKLRSIRASPNALPTTGGLWIGGEECCEQGRFKGMIKSVKIWKRALSPSDLKKSMETQSAAYYTNEAQTQGLVGYWELGEVLPPPCVGLDHGGEDWILDQSSTIIISGSHCNISQFTVPENTVVFVKPWNGSTGGTLQIQAKNILIAGTLNAHAAGYKGGSIPGAGASGQQGESYPGLGKTKTSDNRGGGGGGQGGTKSSDHRGRPGGGGGYGNPASYNRNIGNQANGYGSSGQVYGDETLSDLYLGSGGGSGGSATNLTINPPGGKGGNGGGAISLKAELSVKISGKITATGEPGQGDSTYSWCPPPCTSISSRTGRGKCSSLNVTACWDESGAGGGGSGGSIFISAKSIAISERGGWRLDVSGGVGGYAPFNNKGGTGGSGRVRLEYITYTGNTRYYSPVSKIYSSATLQNEFMDLSQAGQKLIDLSSTQYGNEVLRGCFVDNTTYRMLSVPVTLSSTDKQRLTQDKCIRACRLKGYKYSGTEYHNECYCDNHLKMQLKRPDSECNTPCTGDRTQMCGGTYRILVFGPPPGSPAVGHSGAVSKCEPWCVTADQNSNTPKWGQCSLTTEFVTSWQIHCDCPSGFTGVGCAEVCTEWTWGSACRRNCTCNQNNTISCLPQTGQCQCKPGFHGTQCQTPCPDGHFGTNCLNLCNCTGASDCDKATGKCICQPGWYGHNCNFPCPPGVWGRNCSSVCECVQGSCDPVAGTCDCKPGYKLPMCADTCEPGVFGPNCMYICDCNGQRCDPISGVCDCDSGYTGHTCEKLCPYNTYGKHCAQSCNCLADFDCDHQTGACVCGPGYLGPHCDQPCPQGTYGVNCQKHCVCQMNQTEKCETDTGLCTCKPGFLGDDCKLSCPIGFFGPGCTSTCNCHNEAPCDKVTGACTCPAGWTGLGCENACQEPYYGNCSTVCPNCLNGFCDKGTGQCRSCPGTSCQCSEGFYGDRCQNECDCFHGHCSGNGQCLCSPGWQGSQCDQQCPTDHFGAGCNQTCHCDHGKCHQEIGICICDPGFHGDHCDQPCSNNTYGSNCRRECLACGRFSTGTCDPATGHCQCVPGYKGILCTTPCPTGKFGANCSQTCACERGTCRQTDGFCYCPDGWTGTKCHLQCPPGKWGYNCSNACKCSPHSNGCDPVSGQCQCQPGFAGVYCRESCKDGMYGQNCTNHCRCNPYGFTVCSPIDGSCQCRLGYTGDMCERVCNPGQWGLDCKMNCECSNHGNCNPFTGACDCLPGFNGTNCQFSCPASTFGKNCGQSCNCNGGTCDPRNGICSCSPGRKGHQCELVCESTHFGFDCAQPCVCQNEGVCNPVNGDCLCQPGWSGIRCDKPCPEGQFGVNCAQTCPPCQNDGSCDSVTGQCSCASGYTGPLCNETCTPGLWGSGCTMQCPTSCSSTCFSTTGTCNCLPGACLNGGVCNKKGLCLCVDGFHGTDCSLAKGTQLSGSVSAHTSTKSSGSAIYLSKGSMAGIVLGLIIMALIAVTAVFLLMRKRYTGQFIHGTGGVAKTAFSPEVKEDTNDGAAGFSNPLHFSEFSTPKTDPDETLKDSAA